MAVRADLDSDDLFIDRSRRPALIRGRNGRATLALDAFRER
jgi:hypothetical protein